MSRTLSMSNGSVDSLNVSRAMRLQAKRAPDLLNRRAPQSAGFRHAAAAPVRLAARRRLERPHDHLLDLLIADLPRGPRARLVIQPVQSLANKPTAPFAHRDLRHPQAFRDDLVVVPLRARQDDPRPPRQMRCRPRPMGQRVESHAFVVASESAHSWGVPVPCSPPCRRVRRGRASYFTFFAVRATNIPRRTLPDQDACRGFRRRGFLR